MVTSRQRVCRISRNKMAWTDGNALEHFFSYYLLTIFYNKCLLCNANHSH